MVNEQKIQCMSSPPLVYFSSTNRAHTAHHNNRFPLSDISATIVIDERYNNHSNPLSITYPIPRRKPFPFYRSTEQL